MVHRFFEFLATVSMMIVWRGVVRWWSSSHLHCRLTHRYTCRKFEHDISTYKTKCIVLCRDFSENDLNFRTFMWFYISKFCWLCIRSRAVFASEKHSPSLSFPLFVLYFSYFLYSVLCDSATAES